VLNFALFVKVCPSKQIEKAFKAKIRTA